MTMRHFLVTNKYKWKKESCNLNVLKPDFVLWDDFNANAGIKSLLAALLTEIFY
jgi:hypothetical protein